jgi:hypothetical protein
MGQSQVEMPGQHRMEFTSGDRDRTKSLDSPLALMPDSVHDPGMVTEGNRYLKHPMS